MNETKHETFHDANDSEIKQELEDNENTLRLSDESNENSASLEGNEEEIDEIQLKEELEILEVQLEELNKELVNTNNINVTSNHSSSQSRGIGGFSAFVWHAK